MLVQRRHQILSLFLLLLVPKPPIEIAKVPEEYHLPDLLSNVVFL